MKILIDYGKCLVQTREYIIISTHSKHKLNYKFSIPVAYKNVFISIWQIDSILADASELVAKGNSLKLLHPKPTGNTVFLVNLIPQPLFSLSNNCIPYQTK